MRHGGAGHRDCRHHQQVVGRQGLQRTGQRHPRGVPPRGSIEQVVQGGGGKRQELHVQGLHVPEAHEGVRIEGVGQPGDEPGPRAADPALGHDRHRQAARREPDERQHVVDRHRREPERKQRQAHDPLHDHVFGERQRAWLGIEDVGVEEVQRGHRQLVRHPGQHPGVERRVGVVGARHRRQTGSQRPRVCDGQGRKQG